VIKGLREKFRKNEKGFTLIEMLIVVAIIAILIAVSIPMVNAALERARKATDAANERAAKAEIISAYLVGGTTVTKDTDYAYNAATGALVENTTSLSGNGYTYGKCSDHKDEYVIVQINDEAVVKTKWSGDGDTYDSDLCTSEVT